MDEKEKLTQIVKMVQKDIGQFALLYSHIINKVYFWCYSIIGNEADAKDITQEAMIQIYKSIHSLRNPETFNSWMYRLVRNSCLNYIRLHKKKDFQFSQNNNYNESFEDTLKEERSYNLPKEAYDLAETKVLIKSFIDKLPRKQREVIILYYLEEFRTTEIAEALNYNIGSVRSRLHAGRKNLQIHIKEYQDKNNIKIYNASVLSLLGIVLSDYREEVCNNQDLQYDSNLYNVLNNSLLGNILQVLSSKLTIAITSIVCISLIVVVVVNILQSETLNTADETEINIPPMKDLEMINNLKVHPYIKSIIHLEFPMRDSVDVTIKLKKNVEKKDIKILFNDEELSFEKNNQDILLQVTDNGTYTVITKEYKLSFIIDNIDSYAPELVEAFNNNGYLLLVISDELSQINYEKSYIKYHNEKYEIPVDGIINGEFHGLVKVTIFHYNGHKIIYELDFK
ncbi:MAG: RNA polymerase sigma factor [Coprobacillaceae bacterium]